MKAILCTAYGPPEVLQLREMEMPTIKDDEVLIKIHASTVTMGDCELRSLTLPLWSRLPMRLYMGYNKPKHFIPGMEISGVIEKVGDAITDFKPGDEVFGSTGIGMGGNAEYKALSTKNLALKPATISHLEATTIALGGINALHFLSKANIKSGQHVLIVGAGGTIGTYGVQLAKYYGAEVTAVDTAEKLDMLQSIGADHVVDYKKQNALSNGKLYDVIFDMIYSTPFNLCLNALKPNGKYLMANGGPRRMLKGIWVSKFTNKKVISALASENREDLSLLASLVSRGVIQPVIDRTYPLEKVAEAHEYVQNGHKKGSVVISIEP